MHAESTQISITTGSATHPDAFVTASDETVHRLLTGRVTPQTALADGSVSVVGKATSLTELLALFDFPPIHA